MISQFYKTDDRLWNSVPFPNKSQHYWKIIDSDSLKFFHLGQFLSNY